MKTSELTGVALDWAVAKCEGATNSVTTWWFDWHPSTNWAQGGPIIEREKIGVKYTGAAMEFVAWKRGEPSIEHDKYGPTPLIAAMRCFVASRLGDEVDIPKELV
jgi:hypothetical protein